MKFKLSPSDRREMARAAGLLTHIGLTMAICIGGCILVGNWLDRVFDTSPVFLLIFIFLGSASALLSLYKIVMNAIK